MEHLQRVQHLTKRRRLRLLRRRLRNELKDLEFRPRKSSRRRLRVVNNVLESRPKRANRRRRSNVWKGKFTHADVYIYPNFISIPFC